MLTYILIIAIWIVAFVDLYHACEELISPYDVTISTLAELPHDTRVSIIEKAFANYMKGGLAIRFTLDLVLSLPVFLIISLIGWCIEFAKK